MLPDRSRTIMASGATAVKSPSSLASSARPCPATSIIERMATVQSQILIAFGLRPGV